MRSPAHCLNLPILLLTCMLERDDNGMWKENRNQRLCRMKSQPWKGIVRECLECSRIRRKDGGGGGERRLGIRLNAGGARNYDKIGLSASHKLQEFTMLFMHAVLPILAISGEALYSFLNAIEAKEKNKNITT